MTLAAGTKLARYEIRSKLGEGGMGEVYLAQDTLLDRNVALKILPGDVASNHNRMERFVREAKSAAALNHPNIAHIYEIGESHGTHFIAMEYIDGVTLRVKIYREKTPLSKLLKYLADAAEGLAKAHSAGIVHRDLKPENIMITSDGHAKVLDFGLAKLTQRQTMTKSDSSQADTAVMPPFSTPGVIIGTVGYMSPEQALGKTLEIDYRSDIFSFGCILFEAVTGRRAFEGDSAIQSLNKIIYEPSPTIADFNPSAPADLQRIVRRCLAKDPDQRYQSIKDVALELNELLSELDKAGIITTVPLHSRDTSTLAGASQRLEAAVTNDGSPPPTRASSAEYLVASIMQHKWAALASTILIVPALILGIAGLRAYYHARSTEVAIDSIAVLPFQNRTADADTEYLSDGLAESLIYRLSQLPNLKVSPTSSVFQYKGKELDPVKVGQQLGVNAVLSGRIVQRGDNLTISANLVDVRYNKLLWGEQYERKMSDLLSTQREMAREIVDKLKLSVTGNETGLAKQYTTSNEAYQLYLKGRFYWNKRSEEGMQKSLDYYQQAIEKDPNFALAYSGIADAYVLLGAPDAAAAMPPNEAMLKAKSAALKALEIDETLAEPHVSLAHVKFYDRDWAGTEQEYKRAIELNPNYPTAPHWYAVYLTADGRFDEALTQIKRAQTLDPLSLPINMTFGWILLTARRDDQAVEQLRKTLEMDPNFILAHHRLGLVYEQQGKYEDAIAAFRQVVSLTAGKPLGLSALARAYALAGRRADAERALLQLQEISKRRYVSPAAVATIYAALGDNDRAFTWLEKAHKEHDAILVRLRVDSRFDSLRSDPRFADLLKRVGLPE